MSPFGSHPRPRARARAKNERGAILVEAAFVLPVMILFVMAIIEFGLAFKDLQTVFTATRVGARTASAEPRQFGYADDVSNAIKSSLSAIPSSGWQELWVYKARADGKPDSGNFSSCSTCVRYHWDGATWVKDQDTWPATGSGSQYACGGASPGPDALGVYLKVRHDMLTGFFGSTKTLTDNTVVRLEPLPISSCQG
jgi:TadE-like protein